MFHFRLRRRVRLLVDHLSFSSIASSFAILFAMISAPTELTLRTISPHPVASPGGSLAQDRPFTNASWPVHWHRSIHLWKRLSRRIYLAVLVVSITGVLVLCNQEFAWQASLRHESSARGTAKSAAPVGGDRLSFYDPTQSETELPASTAGSRELRLHARSTLNEAKPSPWAIPESVYFVYRSQTGSGGPARQPLATAFVLSVPDRRQRGFVRFLVTARHVVDPRWARCSETNPSSIDVRLNRRSGGVGYETVLLQPHGHRRFFTPSDPKDDIAILLLDQNLIHNIDEYKFIDVPFRMLPTEAEVLQFRTSQPVITARGGAPPSSDSGNYPVFDGGVLAKMSGDAVNVQCGAAPEVQTQTKPLHLWLINAGSPLGAGGAPVYTAISRSAGYGQAPVLLGIQSVAWPGQGIAGITPSGVLGDLIQTALRENAAGLDFYKGPALMPKEILPSLY